jgi:tRNA nucleotidyltransferase/poly(A) polymerase
MLDLLSLPYVAFVRDLAQARRTPVILVGGAVRDALLGQQAHDLDFAVQGNTVAFGRIAADRLGGAFYLMDAERGTARVIIARENEPDFHLDFALCRGATWDEDLLGRDFSINAIAFDLLTGEWLDPTSGRADLARTIVRQASPRAISDDPIRALRAVRMELALGGAIEPATLAATRAAAPLLGRPSPERVRDELMKILAHPNATRGMRRLDELGLLAAVVPEVEPMRGITQSLPHHFDVLEHTFVVMEYLDRVIDFVLRAGARAEAPPWLQSFSIAPYADALARQLNTLTANERQRAAVLRFAALLHDAAKPEKRSVGDDGRIHFYEHEDAGAEMAVRRANALKLSSDEVSQIRATVREHMRPNQMSRDGGGAGPSSRAIFRYMQATGACAPEIALFCIADGMGKAGPYTPLADAQRRAGIASLLIERYYRQFSPQAAPKALLGGKDVMALGVKPGPRIGVILAAVREAQMVGEISTPEQALELAKKLSKDE